MLALLLLACSPQPAAAPPELAALDGTWTGRLDVGGQGLPLVLHVRPEGATLDSPDQGAMGIPVDAIVGTPANLTLEVSAVRGTWSGALQGDLLEGRWTQGGVTMPLSFARGDAAPAKKGRPQDPVPPFPYSTSALTVTGPAGTLAGTLTVPQGEGPFPALVFVSGSGPQDRDEALLGHRPFLVLADALARAGIASVRYDDRGVGASTGDYAAATIADFVGDADAVVRAARTQPELGAVGVLGHSEGGMIAAMLDPAPAFVVLLAGPATTGRGVVESQVEALARASGASDADAKAARAHQARILDVVARGGSEAEVRAAALAEGVPADQLAAQLPVLTSAWYRSLLAADPGSGLAKLQVPVLALYGDKDLQVVPSENADLLRKLNPRATVTVLPGLNHLLQPATTGLPSEYGAIDTTIDPVALSAITKWVTENAR